MRFVITLNMPSVNGDKYISQVIGDHPANSVAEICEELAEKGYVLIDEFYAMDGGQKGYRQVGLTSVHERVVGKIREMR
jgi:hypothetical protein